MVSCRQILLAARLGLVLALVSSASSRSKDCIDFYHAQNASPFSLKLQDGVNWPEMQARCGAIRRGYGLADDYNMAESAMCEPEQYYPVGIVSKNGVLVNTFNGSDSKPDTIHKQADLNADSNFNIKYGALLRKNNGTELKFVDIDKKFRCAICKMRDRLDVFQAVYPQPQDSSFAYNLELVTYARVDDIGLVAEGSDLANQYLKDLTVALDIPLVNLRWQRAELNGDHKAVVHVYYDPKVAKRDWSYYVHWNDRYFQKSTFKNFELISITLNNECASSKLNLNNMKTLNFPIGYVDSSSNLEFNEVTTRECFWNSTTQQAEWSPNTTWTISIKKCDSNEMSETSRNSSTWLKTTDIIAFYSVNAYLQSVKSIEDQYSRNKALVHSAFEVIDKLLTNHVLDGEPKTALAVLDNALPLQLAKIYTLFPKSILKADIYEIQGKFSIALIADMDTADSVVGLALKLDENSPPGKTVVETISHSNIRTLPLSTFDIVVTFSDSIVATADRLAIVTIATHLDTPGETAKYDPSIEAWLSLVQVSFARSELILKTDDDYVDIAFKPVFHLAGLKGKCAERKFATEEWSDEHCQNVDSSIEGMVKCRCKIIYQEGNLTTGMYIIYGFSSSSKFFDYSTWSMIWVSIILWALPKIIS